MLKGDLLRKNSHFARFLKLLFVSLLLLKTVKALKKTTGDFR